MDSNRSGLNSDGTAKPSSNLDFKSQITSQNRKTRKTYQIKGIKCSCRKAWCPTCGKKTTIKRFSERVAKWKWNYVRQLVLTVDHRLYKSPEDAIKTINGKGHIPNMIRNLERTKGIEVIDWIWVIEWHKSGYPHWHLFLLVNRAGRDGQIGFKNVVQYWKSGYIKESNIKDEKHWQILTGYFEKHGYFDKKKAHQSRLPEWARKKNNVIRRIGSKSHPSEKSRKRRIEKYLAKMEKDADPCMKKISEIMKAMELGLWFENQGNKFGDLTEGEKLDLCGSKTECFLDKGFKRSIGIIDIPYKEFRKFPGEYVPGEGYFACLDTDQVKDFLAKTTLKGNCFQYALALITL